MARHVALPAVQLFLDSYCKGEDLDLFEMSCIN